MMLLFMQSFFNWLSQIVRRTVIHILAWLLNENTFLVYWRIYLNRNQILSVGMATDFLANRRSANK
jgi:hypothetical protein